MSLGEASGHVKMQSSPSGRSMFDEPSRSCTPTAGTASIAPPTRNIRYGTNSTSSTNGGGGEGGGSSGGPSTKGRPLPLKQRTSSADPRRDYSTQTWTSVIGLLKTREYFITVDHFSIWRRHLAWAMEDGKELRDYMTQRYASSMVFMSLLLSTELGVLFNSAPVTTSVREALMEEQIATINFWTGIVIIISAILTIFGLISTFTAWSMVSAVNEANAHCIFRSSIGQYMAELPGRFIVCAIYSFLLWLMMFFFILLPLGMSSMFLSTLSLALFMHTITAFSAFGRVIMHTGAMGSNRIFDPDYEASLLPHCLHTNLLTKARANLSNNTSIMRQYRSEPAPIRRHVSEGELSPHLGQRSDSLGGNSPQPPTSFPLRSGPARNRTESLVKFADGYDTFGDRLEGSPQSYNHNDASPTAGMPSLSTMTPVVASTNALHATHSQKSSAAVIPMPRPPRSGFVNLKTRQMSGGKRTISGNGDSRSALQSSSRHLESPESSGLMFEKWLTMSNSGDEINPRREELNLASSTSDDPDPDLIQHEDSMEDYSTSELGGMSYTGVEDRQISSTPEFRSGAGPLPRSPMATAGLIPARVTHGDRQQSVVSVLDDIEYLTEEERFDREYGDLFLPANSVGSKAFESDSATPFNDLEDSNAPRQQPVFTSL